MGSQVGGMGFGGQWVVLGHGGLGLRVGGLFLACFGFARADFPLVQGGVGLVRGGFCECGFGVWGGIGWYRLV